MSPRTGRPPLDKPKDVRVETRMTQENLGKLDFCCTETGKSRSEVIRDGIDRIYDEVLSLKNK